MKQVPADLSQDDLHQWLSNCYFYHRIPATGKYELSYLSPVAGAGGGHSAWGVQHIASGDIIPIPHTDELWCHWPIGGAINWPHLQYSVYVERLPRKQWKRSYCGSYYSVKRIGTTVGPEFQMHKTNRQAVVALLEPTYYSYTQIIRELFPNGWESAAINSQLTILKGDLPKVYFNKDLVGKVTPDKQLFLTDRALRRYLLPHFDGLVE